MKKYEVWISAWIDLASSIIVILTFALARPNWELGYVLSCVRKRANKHIYIRED